MKLYISSICFIVASFLACVPWGFPWNIPFQFVGCALMLNYYWDTPDRIPQMLSNAPVIMINIIGVILIWIH